MNRSIVKTILPVFGLAVFGLALWALFRELHTYHLKDILAAMRSLPRSRLLLAAGFTALSYTVATGYDTLGVRYIRQRLPYRCTSLAAFVGTTFSNNMGFGILTGGSIRLRLYSAWGLSAVEITKLVFFNTATLWLGFLGLGGLVFTLEPMALPRLLHLPFPSVRPVGLIFLGIVAAYLLATLLRRAPLSVRGVEVELPRPGLFPLQIAVSFLDWSIAGAALYLLLPSGAGLSYPAFLGLYMLSLLAGIFSQVPGGLGVFETVFLLLMTPRLPASAILGSLLAYRGIYYFGPLAMAFVLLGAQELRRRQEQLRKTTAALGRWSSAIAPPVLSVLTLAAGGVLLVSGATPAISERLAWLARFLPLPVMTTSHFFGSTVGVLLILLARGVQRRLDAAYVLTVALLGAGIVASLLKGGDYEEAIILAVMLAIFLPSRRYFYRKAALFRPRPTVGWVAAMLFVIGGTLWVTLFAHKHYEYSWEQWWKFAFDPRAPRALRALTAGVLTGVIVSLATLLRPHRPRISPPGQIDRQALLPVVRQSPESCANLALLGDKDVMFSAGGNAFIMYRRSGRSWVSMGDPVGPQEEWPELIWSFRELADQHGGWTVFYQVGAGSLNYYLDLGLALRKLGEEGRVHLPSFSLEGREHKRLRYAVNKLEREGVSFEVLPAEAVPGLLLELKAISDDWLAHKHTREKGFSLGYFDEEYLKLFPVALVRQEGRVVAFANLWVGDPPQELSLDLMRHLAEAPEAVMEYLFVRLMMWGRERGYAWFNLGMVPLAGLADHSLAPLWDRVGTLIFRQGEYFYNFQGLRQFKEKFGPVWNPRYLASPGGLALPTVLANIVALVSGGIRGLVTK